MELKAFIIQFRSEKDRSLCVFISRCLPNLFPKPFSGKDWIFEMKWDGYRAIAYVDDYFTVQSRNAKELKNFFPELEELRQLAKNVVVDGEIITMKQGKVDFHALQII